MECKQTHHSGKLNNEAATKNTEVTDLSQPKKNDHMQIQLKAPKIWLANEPTDFRKGQNGLSELVTNHFNQKLENGIYIFHNRDRNKLKLLSYHHNGALLIYKSLNKKRFTLKNSTAPLSIISENQLSWLLAGLNWIDMSRFEQQSYDDYF